MCNLILKKTANTFLQLPKPPKILKKTKRIPETVAMNQHQKQIRQKIRMNHIESPQLETSPFKPGN